MKRSLLYYISPFSILAVICFVLMIDGLIEFKDFDVAGNYFFVIVFVAAILILCAVGWAVRFATKGKILYIWIIEVILVVVFVWLLNGSSFRISGC